MSKRITASQDDFCPEFTESNAFIEGLLSEPLPELEAGSELEPEAEGLEGSESEPEAKPEPLCEFGALLEALSNGAMSKAEALEAYLILKG